MESCERSAISICSADFPTQDIDAENNQSLLHADFPWWNCVGLAFEKFKEPGYFKRKLVGLRHGLFGLRRRLVSWQYLQPQNFDFRRIFGLQAQTIFERRINPLKHRIKLELHWAFFQKKSFMSLFLTRTSISACGSWRCIISALSYRVSSPNHEVFWLRAFFSQDFFRLQVFSGILSVLYFRVGDILNEATIQH